MTPPPHRRTRRRGLIAVALTVGLAATAPFAASVGAQEPEDPALDQTIERDQAIATGRVVLDDGHVDIGPRLVDDAFTLMVHDDAVIPAVWRPLEGTVLAVGDEALQAVPDDPTYDFLGVEPGTDVHVIPQVQRPGVVWVGWNTQDPEVMERIDRGATLTLLGVQGPGDLVMYLQSGALGDPEVLWRSTVAERQPIWVEVNTHTHANWVFTEPGTYLVQVEIAAELTGGEAVSDVRTLRFAVGDDVDPEAAFDEAFTAPVAADPATRDAEDGGDDPSGGGGGVLVVGGLVAVVLAGAVVAVVVRGNRARSRAEQERTEHGRSGQGTASEGGSEGGS